METHVKILGILYIAFNILSLIAAIIIFTTLMGLGIISGEREAIGILFIISMIVTTIMVILSLPGILGGIGLLKLWSWARILVLILGFLNLLSFPIGTALGIYTIWVLVQDKTAELFA
ncbi:hypothetical protein JXI42_12295 [bacterium]|nr:hypothetical protein [bacterium]